MSLKDTLPELSFKTIDKQGWISIKEAAEELDLSIPGVIARIEVGKMEAGIFKGLILVKRN